MKKYFLISAIAVLFLSAWTCKGTTHSDTTVTDSTKTVIDTTVTDTISPDSEE